MIGFYNYTVVATYLSLASSVFGIVFAVCGQPLWAVYCLMLSGALDTFDGRIARTKKNRTLREIRFGVQIDSLCDLVCFGVLPAVIGFCSVKAGMTVGSPLLYIYTVCAVCYVLGAVIRLSFFNIHEEETRETAPKGEKKTYTGLPVTTSALVFPLVYILKQFFGEDMRLFGVIYAVVLLAVAFGFVGKFHVRKPDTKGVIFLISFGAVIAVLIGVIYGICK